MWLGASIHGGLRVLAQAGGVSQTPAEIFDLVFLIFLVLGTLVGIVVIAYIMYNAYKYRVGEEEDLETDSGPSIGELPTGSGGGRKLFLSFGISALIVLSLIAWTYGLLTAVEDTPEADIEVDVIGHQFSWEFIYPNGESESTLRVPQDEVVVLNVTSADVFHNIGIPAFGMKTDAIPGSTATTWFVAEETGTYMAHCYELCGGGHSGMDAEVIVMEQDSYQSWYQNMTGS